MFETIIQPPSSPRPVSDVDYFVNLKFNYFLFKGDQIIFEKVLFLHLKTYFTAYCKISYK